MSSDPFSGELEKLREEYAAKLLLKVNALVDLAERLGTAPAYSGGVADLHRELHTIAGAAKTFGQPNASQQARAAEALLETFVATKANPDATTWKSIMERLQALRQSAT